MITTQRVIIYRIDDDSDEVNFEIIDSYDFSTPMIVVPIGLYNSLKGLLKHFFFHR
jgi:hypothetical protein